MTWKRIEQLPWTGIAAGYMVCTLFDDLAHHNYHWFIFDLTLLIALFWVLYKETK